ncbi:hypothetical protein IQ07DRAFT_591258 [Pyrenochaeta sp. DS3sAY3a]|nr:hypothetical protein IQ07DRAFT_591258 [Pyrenochaeta sp. DS3sAY3a]
MTRTLWHPTTCQLLAKDQGRRMESILAAPRLFKRVLACIEAELGARNTPRHPCVPRLFLQGAFCAFVARASSVSG